MGNVGFAADFSENQKFVMLASPTEWDDYAQELYDAALLLWEHREEQVSSFSHPLKDGLTRKSFMSRTFILLAALSIENLIKGLLVAQEPSLVANGELGKKLKHHKLKTLFNGVSEIELTSDEKIFLGMINESITYWGRYPIPLHARHMETELVATNEIYVCYKALFSKLQNKLYLFLKDGWDGPHDMKLTTWRYAAE